MRSSKSVALLIETSKAYGRGLLQSVGRYARLHGEWSIFVQERGLGDALPEWVAAGRFDGLMFRTGDIRAIDFIQKTKIPTVYLGEPKIDFGPAVLNDDALCSVMAVEHFAERGFREMAFVGIPGQVWSDARQERFATEVDARGGVMHLLEIGHSKQPLTWHETHRRISNWLLQLPHPIGILCCYDALARSVLDAARACELLVPEQVAVVGVDNDEVLCEVCDPPLSSIAPDTDRIGTLASEQLDRLLHGETTTETIIVPPRGLVERGSSDIIALNHPEIARALGFIRRRAIDGIDVDDVVNQLGISRRTLERKFIEELGHPPREEIVRVRLARVKALLKETELSVDEISSRTGFAYTSHLIAVFRKREGMTPLAYRRESRSPQI